MTTVADLVADLRAERLALRRVTDALDAPAWAGETPAAGYDIRDQVWHLAWYDGAAHRSVSHVEEFARESARAVSDMGGYDDEVVRLGRALTPAVVEKAWREQAAAFDDAALDPASPQRVTWYMTRMSLRSLISARIMETWAHGQDIRDGLGLPPENTDRLRQVAHIGCNAMAYAFQVNGLEPPAEPVRVELTLPSGRMFVTGPEDALSSVRGAALHFCLVATQRRHPDDVSLLVQGAAAEQWIPIAQAFAGPPGSGRRPAQFPALD